MKNHHWNHNAAYHNWIRKQIPSGAYVLDVGCGDGLLLETLTQTVCAAVGLEPDEAAAARACRRLHNHRQITVQKTAFENYTVSDTLFDVVIFVASLHHMDAEAALRHALALLAPGGMILVVGCARADGFLDLLLEALRVVPARIGSILHGERNGGDIGVPIKEPTQTYREIRKTASALLPGAVIRRGLYYRYLLSWKKEIPSSGT